MSHPQSTIGNRARRKNPFSPTAPIPPEYFGGRSQELMIILRALNQTGHDSQQNILITGERGIGKSSLAHWARHVAENPSVSEECDHKFATAYYTLDDKDGIAELCHGTVEKLNRTIGQGLSERFFEKLRRWDCSIKLNFWLGSTEVGPSKHGRTESDHSRVRQDYVKLLEALDEELSEKGYNGILIIIDELNKIRASENVGAFFKKVAEDLISDGYRNIMFLIVGLPWIEEKIAADDLSCVRIFAHVSLGPMAPEESAEVIDKALDGTGVTIEEAAKRNLIEYAGGYPYFLQQMCFDSFEEKDDEVISSADVFGGVAASLLQFDRTFFGRVLREAEGKNYQKLIEVLADSAQPEGMRVIEIQKKSKVKGAAQYLPKLLKDGVISSPKKGRYKLASKAFELYVFVERRVGSWKRGETAQDPTQPSP
jgi:hypothetical protein